MHHSKKILSTLLPIFQPSLRYRYIRQKQIDEICKGYGETKAEKTKMYTMMFAHIIKKGFAEVWSDFRIYN